MQTSPRRYLLIVILVFLHHSLALGKVKWKENWKPFSTAEYILTPGLMAGNLLLLDAQSPNPARWKGGILLDGPLRDLLSLNSKNARTNARIVGDILALGTIAYPFFVDALSDVGISKKDPWVASQMTLIAAQSFFLTSFLTLAAKHITGRERPYQKECGVDPAYDDQCNLKDSRLSFFSGHAALAFTGAGLVCSHHEIFDLWGGNLPCYVVSGAALVAAISRCMADKHYTSDIIIGGLVGWFSGYTLPKLLHYKKEPESNSVKWIPVISEEKMGLVMQYEF